MKVQHRLTFGRIQTEAARADQVPRLFEHFRGSTVRGSVAEVAHDIIVKHLVPDMKAAAGRRRISIAVPEIPALRELLEGGTASTSASELSKRMDSQLAGLPDVIAKMVEQQFKGLTTALKVASAGSTATVPPQDAREALELLEQRDLASAKELEAVTGLLRKGASIPGSSSSGGGQGGAQQGGEEGELPFIDENGRPFSPSDAVVRKYFDILEEYFGQPTHREVKAFQALHILEGEDPDIFAARMVAELEVLRDSKLAKFCVSEPDAVGQFLASVSSQQQYREAAQQVQSQLATTKQENWTLQQARALLANVRDNAFHAEQGRAAREATLSAMGLGSAKPSTGSGGNRGEKGEVRFTATDSTNRIAKALASQCSASQLAKVYRGLKETVESTGLGSGELTARPPTPGAGYGATGGAAHAALGWDYTGWPYSSPELLAAAAMGGMVHGQATSATGGAFGVPRPGPMGRGGPFPGGRGQGLPGGQGGRGQGGPNGQWGRGGPGGPAGGGFGGRGQGGGAGRGLPPGAGRGGAGQREPAIMPCECVRPTHGPGVVCYTSNPWHCQRDGKPGPPPNTVDYTTHVHHCQRLGIPPTRQPKGPAAGAAGGVGAGPAGAAALALPDQGAPPEQLPWYPEQQEGEWHPEGAFSCMGGASDATLAGCVPTQPGWCFQANPACSSSCSTGPLLSGGVQVAAAVSTRASGVRSSAVGGGPGVAGSLQPRGLQEQGLGELVVTVTLLAGRDDDLIQTLLERERGGRPVAAAAAGQLRSFVPGAGQQLLEVQAQQWASGRVHLGATLRLPRDMDILNELRARQGMVTRAAQEQQLQQQQQQALGQPEGQAAAAAAVPSSPLSPEEQQKWAAWQANEGGLVYFRNTRAEEGVSLVLPDDRSFLPVWVLMDSGCEPPIMSEKYGRSIGAKAELLAEPRYLIRADGKLATIREQFAGIQMVLKRRTRDETGYTLNFLSMPDSDRLYQVTFPTVFDHRVGGMGVDRLEKQYSYRPRLAEHGDKATVASVPVRCWRSESSKAPGAAAAALGWREVSRVVFEEEEARVHSAVAGVTAAIFSRVLEGVVGPGKLDGGALAASPTTAVARPMGVAAGPGQLRAAPAAAAAPAAGLWLGQGGGAAGPALLPGSALAAGLAASAGAPAQGGVGSSEQEPAGQGEDWHDASEQWEEAAGVRENWRDAREAWGDAAREQQNSSHSTASAPQQGPGFSAWAAAGLGFAGGWVLGMLWSGLGLVLLLLGWPAALLKVLHCSLAALCWRGWEFRSRQQQRLWARSRKKDLRVYKGWSIKQWLRAAILVLLLLMAWGCCSAQAMDPRGVEGSLLVTAGLAVLRMRHPGGAAHSFRSH
jgi:hypothetical protein